MPLHVVDERIPPEVAFLTPTLTGTEIKSRHALEPGVEQPVELLVLRAQIHISYHVDGMSLRPELARPQVGLLAHPVEVVTVRAFLEAGTPEVIHESLRHAVGPFLYLSGGENIVL